MTESYAPSGARYCANGHLVADSAAAFCSTCGSSVPARSDYPPSAIPLQATSAGYGGQYGAATYPDSSYGSVIGEAADPRPGMDAPTSGGHRAHAKSRRILWLAIAALGVVGGGATAAVLVTGGGGGNKTVTVTGRFVLFDSDTAFNNCIGTGGYDDIEPGATVILKNESGKILGSGALSAGKSVGGRCLYRFAITDVSKTEKQYAVEVTHRGQVVDSQAELARHGWKFELSLGG